MQAHSQPTATASSASAPATVDFAEQSAVSNAGTSTPRNSQLARTLASVLFFAGLLVMLAYFFDGKTGAEKTVTQLCFPVGLIWLLLTACLFHLMWCGHWGRASLAGVGWLLFSVLGSAPGAHSCIRSLEYQFTSFAPGIDEELDFLVVLGGGTSQGPQRAQAGNRGDRLVLAAQLFHQGHAKRLITTGDSTAAFGKVRSNPRGHTLEIWHHLGIAPEHIGELNGINTYQEIQSLKLLREEFPAARIGLLSSAFHLPRALRLAQAAGMSDLIPVGADYQAQVEPYLFVDFIPSALSFDQVARSQHEYMAALFAR